MNKCCFSLLNEIDDFMNKRTILEQNKNGKGEEKVKFDREDWDCLKQRITNN